MPISDYIEIGALLFLARQSTAKKRCTGQRENPQATSYFTFIVDEKPEKAGVDPFSLLVDRNPEDNLKEL